MLRISFPRLLLSLTLLLVTSGSIPADDTAPKIDSGTRPPTQAKGIRQWSGSIDDLALQKLDTGFVASGKQWIRLWNAWRFDDERPEVDFTKKLAIISTTRGGRITLETVLDDQGNLHVSGMETRDLRPGFRYAIRIVDRAGVRTVSGKPVPEDREMVQQAVPPSRRAARVRARRVASVERPVRINVTFGTEAEEGRRNGVIDAPRDVWNLIDYAQPELKTVRLADGSASDVRIAVSDNDGEWGIEGPAGAYHAYIYHNCRCVDVSATFEYLPPGIYDLYVFAHGDAPDQNAAIEVESAGVVTTGRATLNDGTWDFRSRKFKDGNQYVKYTVEVKVGHPLVITSRRDGSAYAMLNSIQLERVLSRE
ncbi:MAG: hypothetical protein ACF8TS_18540 [Maioricimonas sp. JB049]